MQLHKKFDPFTTLIPFAALILVFYFFIRHPLQTTVILTTLRDKLTHGFGIYYLILGLAIFLVSMYLVFSSRGKIRLGNLDKPKFSTLTWGLMIFTSTMGADILYWSFTEWIHYASEPHIQNLGDLAIWAPTYTLFHWGPIPWSFYLVMAVIFAYNVFINNNDRQRFSSICIVSSRPKLNLWLSKIIDLTAIIGLLAGATTTFTLVVPLLTSIIASFFQISVTPVLTIFTLLIIAGLFFIMVYLGFQGITRIAKVASTLFVTLLLYVFLLGGQAGFILESAFTSLGNLTQNFWTMATWIDPLRATDFTQSWTIFYWSYWLVWCVAVPFFIGIISEGRTIRSTILGGYFFGLAGTFSSFIVFGNYGLALQLKGKIDLVGQLSSGVLPQDLILQVLAQLPLAKFAFILLALALLAFYTTIFDALTVVLGFYAYNYRPIQEQPEKKIRLFWTVLFLLLPLAILKAENSLFSLQSLAIVTAFPIGIIVFLAIYCFLKQIH